MTFVMVSITLSILRLYCLLVKVKFPPDCIRRVWPSALRVKVASRQVAPELLTDDAWPVQVKSPVLVRFLSHRSPTLTYPRLTAVYMNRREAGCLVRSRCFSRCGPSSAAAREMLNQAVFVKLWMMFTPAWIEKRRSSMFNVLWKTELKCYEST